MLCYIFYMSRKVAVVIGAFIAILILVQLLYDPLSVVQHSVKARNLQSQLAKAKVQWNSERVRHYSFTIRGKSQSICAVDALIEVQDYAVVKVHPVNTASPLPAEKWADPDWGNEVFLCDYNHFTIPQMFAMLEKTLENSPFAVLETEFDPQYGFITRFEDGIFASYGWLNLSDKKVYNEFQISHFKIEQ